MREVMGEKWWRGEEVWHATAGPGHRPQIPKESWNKWTQNRRYIQQDGPVCVRVSVCVCMCVRKRERERGERKKLGCPRWDILEREVSIWETGHWGQVREIRGCVCVSVRVCVCVCQREECKLYIHIQTGKLIWMRIIIIRNKCALTHRQNTHTRAHTRTQGKWRSWGQLMRLVKEYFYSVHNQCDAFSMSPHTMGVLINITHTHTHTLPHTYTQHEWFVSLCIRFLVYVPSSQSGFQSELCHHRNQISCQCERNETHSHIHPNVQLQY